MLAAVLHGIQDLRVDERAVPELDPGTVLVRMRRVGIFHDSEITCGVSKANPPIHEPF
jgi:threonine dehydrogenase-like Zn-dependent dehydrogenase